MKTEPTARECSSALIIPRSILVGIIVLALWCISVRAAPPQYSVTDLGTLGGTQSQGLGINASGQVTGFSSITGNNTPFHAFRHDGTSMIELGTLGGNLSFGHGINASGQVAGWANSTTTGNGTPRAVRWTGTTPTDLGTLGGSDSQGLSINDSGQVTGRASTAGNAETHAFLWNGTSMIDLGTLGGTSSGGNCINSSGQIAGSSLTDGNASHKAFRYNGTIMQNIGTLGGLNSWGVGINSNGHVTGYSYTTGTTLNHAFLWNGTTMIDLGTLGGTESQGYGINASGQVVGNAYTTGNAAWVGFLYSDGVMFDLNTLLASGSCATNIGLFAGGNGINDLGQIAAIGQINGEAHAVLLSPVAIIPITSWRQTHFGSIANSGDGADLNDYDHDSLANLVEYAFGLNPTLNSAGQLPQGQIVGVTFVLSFRESAGVTGITYGAEWSATMASNDWHTIADTGSALQHVFSVPVGANAGLFVRLKVTSP